jgi:hypothetical protein
MRRLFTVASVLFLMSGCAGQNSSITTKNIETAAAIDSAFVPGAALIGVPLAVADIAKYLHDYCSSIGMPKVETISPAVRKMTKETPAWLTDANGNSGWGKYAIWQENGKLQRMKLEDVPKTKLNYKMAFVRAIGSIRQGILSDGNKEVLQRNLEIWKNGGLLAIEYHGPEGATVVAVSNKNEPFEIMLPEEWEQKKSRYGLTPTKPVIPAYEKAKEGNHS